MKDKATNFTREHYRRLRLLSCEELWAGEVPEFDRADGPERMRRVSVIRAVGVVFSESGTPDEKERARLWLRGLLQDPEEKVRRYAMAALPKIGADQTEETALHSLLHTTSSERETRFLARALEKIGGNATLEINSPKLPGASVRKIEANVARAESPGEVRLDRAWTTSADLRISLRVRSGLEGILEREILERAPGKFRVTHRHAEGICVEPVAQFSLADVYALRCFGTMSFILAALETGGHPASTEALAEIIASERTRRIFENFTEGPARYRLEFVGKGHQRGAVRSLAARVSELAPGLLNDSRSAPWEIEIREAARSCSVELTPRLRPDPRFTYRKRDVPAASHPPLAASMVLLAGKSGRETVWDPFCGSGVELMERVLQGGVHRVFGTDLSEEAIAISEENFADAHLPPDAVIFVCGDFRDHADVPGLGAGEVSLIITNPPLGRRVPIPDLPELVGDLFAAAAHVLRPGGRLVFVNPLKVRPASQALKLQFRQKVDLGGFFCHLEKYVRI